jgi:hypothetical protein
VRFGRLKYNHHQSPWMLQAPGRLAPVPNIVKYEDAVFRKVSRVKLAKTRRTNVVPLYWHHVTSPHRPTQKRCRLGYRLCIQEDGVMCRLPLFYFWALRIRQATTSWTSPEDHGPRSQIMWTVEVSSTLFVGKEVFHIQTDSRWPEAR